MIVEPEVVGEFASGSHEAFHKIFKLFYPNLLLPAQAPDNAVLIHPKI